VSREHNELYRFRTGYLKFKSALCDRNTGLLAYPLLMDEVRRFFESREKVAVLVVQVDDLHRVESVYGWQACDQVLQCLAKALREVVARKMGAGTLLAQDGVHMGRFVGFAPTTESGDEVTALWAARVAAEVAHEVETTFASPEYQSMSGGLTITAGSHLLTDNPFFRFERLVAHGIVSALPAPADEVVGHGDLESEMRRILRDDDLKVDYQPILTLAGREIVGYEAQVRGPAGTLLETPALLINYGEQFGLSRDLDQLCRSRAMQAVQELDGDQVLFVNCLPAVLDDDGAADRGLSQLMERTGCPPERLVLAVTEQRLENGGRPTGDALAHLRRLGIRLALDRAGTGFATLKLIEELAPEYIKIEPTLIRNLDANLVQQEVARSMVALARRLGSTVVADGVESEAEAEAARICGVSLAQGQHLAGPQAVPGPGSTRKIPRGASRD
jgi:EAL domain-containing protein (putative c-di-GMP-specific phosphodiesterase class I)/GGDEF domain-containing protein